MQHMFLVCLVLCTVWSPALAQDTAQLNRLEQIRYVTARQPGNRALRFKYAQTSYQAGRHNAAKYHLQILMRTSHSEVELRQLQKAYRTVLSDSPWSFGLNFSFLPSTNINKTSSNEVFDTLLGQFLISNGGTEESGLGARLGVRLGYDTALESGASLSYGLELNRNQYPTDRLNNFDGTVRLTFGQRTINGSTQISPYIRRTLYDASEGNSSDFIRYGMQLSHQYYLTDKSSVTGTLTAERRDYDNLDYLDGNFISTSISYRGPITEDYSLNVRLRISNSAPEQEHLRYFGADLWGEVTHSIDNIGTIGLNANLGMRQYQADFPALGAAREDLSAGIGVSFSSPHIKVFKTTPKLSCRFQQNWSNVGLYDFTSTDCAVSFEHKF
jgi:hypothetical protein